jgi:hypothetical protein
MADARTRSAGGNTRNSMARPTGVIRPPPTPWSTRKATSSLRLVATPHNAEATLKMTMAPSRTRRAPSRSPSHDDAGMKTARLTRKAISVAATLAGRV